MSDKAKLDEAMSFIKQVEDAAAAARFETMVRDLESLDGDLGVVSTHFAGRTLLSWAVVQGRPAAVEVLLHAGADRNKANGAGYTPLELALRCLADERNSPPKASWATWQPGVADYERIVALLQS